MPHITIEYSANLDPILDMAGFCETLRAAAAALDIFPADDVRVRALRAEHYAIADGDSGNSFVDFSVRLHDGRPLQARQHATQAFFGAAKGFLTDIIANKPNTIRNRIAGAD